MNKTKILIGTANSGKIKEIKSILNFFSDRLVFLSDLSVQINEPKEDGTSFAENALIKARAYARATNLPTLAEDSGLVIPSLNNFPGINSARWLIGSDDDRNQALLKKMIAVKDRFAYYQATVCYYQNAQTPPLYTIGKLEGTIALNSSGTEGFGYDPIFIPSGQSQTMAQLGIDFKNSHSARYKAWKQISSRLAIIENFD